MIEILRQIFCETYDKLKINSFEFIRPQGKLHELFVNELTLAFTAVSSIYVIYQIIKNLIESCYSRKAMNLMNKDLSYALFSKSDVVKATRYYIATKYQNISPSNDEEPGRKHIASAKNELIPLFIKEIFSKYGNENKYYLILADSGMGKTTFMINLYLAYLMRKRKLYHHQRLKIKLFSLGDPKTIERLENIDNKAETILLLDAFDEDTKAIIDYKNRMSEILSKVDDFHDIIITCRTHFFPSEIDEPYNTGYISFGDANTKRNFQKIYLSVFSNSDIKKYLRKRIPLYKFRRFRRALKIVRKSPSLVVRPMLLSYIEDLINSDIDFKYKYEVYQVLIEKWVKREASKPGIDQKYGQQRYETILLNFSQNLAVDMYLNRELRGGYYASKVNAFLGSHSDTIEEIDLEKLTDNERRSRSLLNRDAVGNYKFSHKSIMEYFLAKKLVVDEVFSRRFEFKGNETALIFYNEMLINEKIKPIYTYCNEYIIAKCLNFPSYSNIGFLKEIKIFKKAHNIRKKYSNYLNIINFLEIKIMDGIDQLNILYQIFLFNLIVRRHLARFYQANIRPDDLMYFLDNDAFDNLYSFLKETKSLFSRNNIPDRVVEAFDILIIESNIRSTKEIDNNYDFSKFLDQVNLDLYSILEIQVCYTASKSNYKWFISNLVQLLEIRNLCVNIRDVAEIEYLISLFYDFFTEGFSDANFTIRREESISAKNIDYFSRGYLLLKNKTLRFFRIKI